MTSLANGHPPAADLLCSVLATGAAGAGTGPVAWQVAEEVAVAIAYNNRSHAVMMATPADLEDFAVGFSLSEEIVGATSDIRGVTVTPTQDGIVVDIAVDPALLARRTLRKRTIAGRTGCGLCGVSSLKDAVRQPRPVAATAPPSPGAIAAAFARLPDLQPMNRFNHSTHAAAWCDRDGRVIHVREDVGRHNALDKLIGVLATDGVDTTAGFAVMTSRCSFELVQKAAAAGIPCLATVSAPTALALRLARQAGIVLAARARGDVVLFT